MRALAKDFSYDIHQIFDFKTVGMPSSNRIIFGCGAIEKIGEEAANLAQGKALILSDEILEKLGVLEKIKDALASSGFETATFTEVEPEPHLETAEKLYNQFADAGITIVVGVGGGSVLDIAKLAAVSIVNQTPPKKYVSGEQVPESRDMPLILAPTTSGTGSEVSKVIVVSMGEDKKFLYHPSLYADISIVDPTLTISMPPHVTASTGLDALSHAIEGMMHKNASPFSDFLCLGGIELAGAYLRRAYANGEDLEARYHMSLSATLSMMGMIMSGPSYAHSAAYIISKYKPTAHGVGCAIALPYIMAYNAPVISAKLARMAEAMGEPTGLFSETDAAYLAVEWIYTLMEDVGLPTTLEDYGGIQESDLEHAAGLMIKLYPRPLNPRPMGVEESIKFWHNMWKGNLGS